MCTLSKTFHYQTNNVGPNNIKPSKCYSNYFRLNVQGLELNWKI